MRALAPEVRHSCLLQRPSHAGYFPKPGNQNTRSAVRKAMRANPPHTEKAPWRTYSKI
jgi:hypothetical protein